jgi:membrane-associated protease RseP (regulator of RpoE activity)
MNFFVYDVVFLIVSSLLGLIFLYKRRKNLKREMGIFLLYRTKVGIKLIETTSKRYKRLLGSLKYVIISVGYVLMVSVIYLFARSAYIYVRYPFISKMIDSPPITIILPYFPKIFGMQDIFPEFYFTYFLVAFIIVATIHEFAHGIYARLYNVRIKSTGVVFLGPLMAGAFVEQDDKQMEKAKKTDQMAILGAGVFVNALAAIIFFLVWWLLFSVNFVPNGALFDSYSMTNISTSAITSIGGINVTSPTSSQLIEIINQGIPKDLVIEGEQGSLNFTGLIAGGRNYYFEADSLKKQLEEEPEQVLVYSDFPAINAGLKGAIIEIDGKDVKTYNDLGKLLQLYKPGDKIDLKTDHNGKILEYNIELTEDPDKEGRAVIGISNTIKSLTRFDNTFAIFKEPFTNYKSKSDLLYFLYYLVFWVFLLNLLVAVFNMLPVLIFDGGRFFYLTIWGITKNEKVAKKSFKWAGVIFLLLLLVIMTVWVLNKFIL